MARWKSVATLLIGFFPTWNYSPFDPANRPLGFAAKSRSGRMMGVLEPTLIQGVNNEITVSTG
jgi:hypothetical protein